MAIGVALSAEPPSRPFAAAGANARTLLVSSEQRASYSLRDNLELLKLQLLRVATRLETIPVAEAVPAKLAEADYLVIFCPQSAPALTTNFLQAVSQSKQPLLWVGFGADQLEKLSPFKTNFQVSAFSAPDVATNVNYRGRNWDAPISPWIPATLSPNSACKVLMSIVNKGTQTNHATPLCWQLGQFTLFAGIPGSGPSGFLFEDMLLDFYGVKPTPAPQFLLRIDDYQARSDHREFQRMADFLYSRQIPFVVAVLPGIQALESGAAESSDSQPDFINALRYAQQRGGRIILKGISDEPAQAEFWNNDLDRPLREERPENIREQLRRLTRQMLQQGLFPLGWETPNYAASRKGYTEIGRVFSTAIERVQLADSTAREKGVTAGLTSDQFGRLIVPENMEFVVDEDAHPFARIQRMAENITRLRGSVGGCYFFAYQPLDKVTGLVDMLEKFHTAYLDLADLDNVVQLPEMILLSGHAQRTVTLRNALVRWKAFDRSGKVLAEEKEPARSSGPRALKRRGVGDYELFEFEE